MSLTKRRLESLSEEEQNVIVGPIDYPIDFDGCEPFGAVPMDELSIARYVEPAIKRCDVCDGSGWIVLMGPDTVHAVCPFCNKDGRYVEPTTETEDESAEPETNWLADDRKVDQFIAGMNIWLEHRR